MRVAPMKETDGTFAAVELNERMCPACRQYNVVMEVMGIQLRWFRGFEIHLHDG
jgi:hypothetical protein